MRKRTVLEEFKAQGTKGRLYITEQNIRLEFGQLNKKILARDSLSSIEEKMGIPSLFGFGGSTHLIFHGKGGEVIDAGKFRIHLAKQIREILGM